MEQKSGKGLLILLSCLVVLSLLLSVGYGVAINKKVKGLETPVVDLTSQNTQINSLTSEVAGLKASFEASQTSTASGEGEEAEVPTDRANQAYDEILKDEDEEALAEQLATEYLSTKDFKKVLVEFLKVEGETPEDYKAIKEVVIKDVDVKLLKHSNDAKVTFELKVSYFNDGDDDEEDLEKVKFTVELIVEDLDEDEDYEDAEVADVEVADFTLIKTYE